MRNTQPNGERLLEVQDLKMHFPVTEGVLQRKTGHIKAVDGVSFHVERGETLGLVGESGCGKSTTGRCVVRLYEATSGSVKFEGRELFEMGPRELRKMRKKMQLIFQDAVASLDPRMKVRDLVGEPLLVHNVARGKEYDERVDELLRMVELEPYMASRYPHEFSGGQRQRIGIARALALRPDFVVCDEPVSALDVSIQAQIVALLERLRDELNLTYLFIAHDLAVVRHISDRIVVMYLGHIAEVVSSDELYSNPLHPYTKSLLSAVPIPDPKVDRARQRIIMAGDVPSAENPPSGCVFRTRCFMAKDICSEEKPLLRDTGNGHMAACHFV